jgi:hypothetical protein
MQSLKKLSNIAGLLVFLTTLAVYYYSVERTGSLWDCGEFILGAYKLQVVHPPGAGLFVLVGRLFAWIATVFSDDPADIAFAVNLMSAVCTSVAATMMAWVTIMLGKLALVGRTTETDNGQNIALTIAGIVTGLAAGFTTSVWFSAVEGEVYAMSTMFTAVSLWAAIKYYFIEEDNSANRWLILSLFVTGMSVGVHLLSLLALPATALLVYYKKYKDHTWQGALIAMAAGVGAIVFIQKFIIVGIPTLWKHLDIFCVNTLGLPVHSGIVPTLAIFLGASYVGLMYAHKKGNEILQLFVVSSLFIAIAFSTIGVVVVRANADTPINMNVPSDATRLLPYLNREQYGERPLLSGPHYDAKPVDVTREPRYGLVDGKYKIVDEKFDYVYEPKDKIFFPRIGHTDPGRPELHKMWREAIMDDAKGKPDMAYNLSFMMKYQVNWMYFRYFMWNFVGRQNAEQGFMPWDVKSGQWESGIKAIDEGKLYKMDNLPDTLKRDKANNHYYFLPLLFGLLGMYFHGKNRSKDFFTLFVLFVITGIGIIIYSNQPPNEPRERDYVLVGSFITFCVWIGMAVLAIYQLLVSKLGSIPTAAFAGLIVLSAPAIMAFENFDDHSRMHHYGSRDYASNFLNSVQPNAIIFTYGDNDTYPLWYAQEVEGIRRDVRVVNLSLIAVDWYINKLRAKVNDSAPIKLTLDEADYRGGNRNQVFFYNPDETAVNAPVNVFQGLRMIKDPKFTQNDQTFVTSRIFQLPVDREKYNKLGFQKVDSTEWAPSIDFRWGATEQYMQKDELAVMDLIASNFYERPIYFSITCQASKLLNLNDFTEMEGLGLRISPTKIRMQSNMPQIYGYGDIDVDKTYDIVMNKWKWGNFDKVETFIDKSYGAELQAMRMVMMREAITLEAMKNQDKKIGRDTIANTKRAVDVCKKYFEAFPHFNFAYDGTIMPFISVMVRCGAYDEAKKHLRILANEDKQYIEFIKSQTSPKAISSFRQDLEQRMISAEEIINRAKEINDPAFIKEMEGLLGKYIQKQDMQMPPIQ